MKFWSDRKPFSPEGLKREMKSMGAEKGEKGRY